MISLVRTGGRPFLLALATGWGVWLVSVASSLADDIGAVGVTTCPRCQRPCRGQHVHADPGPGAVGDGFQGFGLGFHLGYGYGGKALGVGPDGGYPFYGGPGYPHPGPELRRLHKETPFFYYGGPGGPCPDGPNYLGGVGPLAPDQPVVTFERDPSDPGFADDYGPATGTIPYPETTFAPHVSILAVGGSSSRVGSSSPPNPAPASGETLEDQGAGRDLGIVAEPLAAAGQMRGLKVTRVVPGSPAEKAGLHVGDVIRSINGYATERPGHLAWILARATPDKLLKMSVQSASDGAMRTFTTRTL